MAYTPLAALQLNDHYARICIRVTRKWEYRGPADDGPIQHVDMVLADHEGNSMHAEIPNDMVEEFNAQIEEGNIYEIRRFRVANAKSFYKPVDECYMIQFTFHTQIVNPRSPPIGIPRYVYKLTSYEDLPMLVGNVRNFLDVLGVITQVGDPQMVHVPNNHVPAITRKLIIKDTSDVEMKITLWGQRATQFSTDGTYNAAEKKPIVALFVGLLMKSYAGNDYLSGSSACSWYFNPDIPEAQEFYNRYAEEQIEIAFLPPAPEQVIQPQPAAQPEERTLHELQNIDPYEFPRNGCRCTVTIIRLVPDVSWWFPSCGRCGKSCSSDNNGYICYPCNSTNYRHKYKLVFVASDGTAEAQMICFGQIAQRIIGKPVEQVMRTVRRNEEFPPDIAAVVSQRYTFAVTITNQSFYKRQKSFMVNSIVTAYGRQRVVTNLAGTSSSHQPCYPRGPGTSTFRGSSSNQNQSRTPPSTIVHHTPPHDPPATTVLAKDAPALEPMDTPRTYSVRKRLTYENSEPDEDSDNEHHRRGRFDRMKGPAGISIADETAAEHLPKRTSPECAKTSNPKHVENKSSRSQKNK